MKTEIAIIGAGPYGLSAASHIQTIPSVAVKLFGKPMSFWENQMPNGMLLRSGWEASHLADPQRALTLDAYKHKVRNHFSSPVPLDRFVEYGRWFQQTAHFNVDTRNVTSVRKQANSFSIQLEDGTSVKADRVIVAAGIARFAWRPPEFANLPVPLASHSSEHCNLTKFSGKRVAVVGGGQSALESAALLHESGADVCVIVRKPRVCWLGWKGRLKKIGLLGNLLYSSTDVGPAGLSHLVSKPNLFRRLPRGVQDKLAARSIRPAGAAWLKPRLKNVTVLANNSIKAAVPSANALHLRLASGDEIDVDHLLLATGYRINIAQYEFLTPDVLSQVRQHNGYPELNGGFESSVAGLHFLGAPAAWTFGPLMRFVSGAQFAASALTDFLKNTGLTA